MLAVARWWLVRPEQRFDFDWLVQQPGLQGQKVGTLLEHLELADLQRNFFFPHMDKEMYRNYVLSPQIVSAESSEIHWRREVWENFYPSIRNETNPTAAAQSVARLLRERITILPGHVKSEGVEQMWGSGVVDPEGFETLNVAVLQSIGIPARMSATRQIEFWNGNAWTTAPRPVVETMKDLESE